MAPLFLFLLTACSAPSSGLHADATKLRAWSNDLDSAQPLPLPFVADFEAGPRSLTYAAVNHSEEKSSASMTLLQGVMNQRRFGVVVLEGIPRSMGLSPEDIKDDAESDGKDGYYRHGETSLAITQAQVKNIPFVGAEPDEADVKRAALRAGYSLNDLFGFYVLRLVPQWRLDGTLTRNSFATVFDKARLGLGRRLGFSSADTPNAADFRAWYQRQLGTPFIAGEVKASASEPQPDGALSTQRLAAVIDRVRSEQILKVTEEMLNRYGHALLVFQGKHYPVQEPALEAMLGKPTRISDEP